VTDLGATVPETGGRVRLVLVLTSSEAVEYDATLAHQTGVVEGRLRVDIRSGAVSAPPAGAPHWLGALAVGLLRAAHRRHQQAGWPRRLSRWRAEQTR
jgi:hypothetical protein